MPELSEPNPLPPDLVARRPVGRITRSLLGWLAGFAVLYAGFAFIHYRFPYIQSGAALVARLKHTLAREGHPFANRGALKVMIFGHSKILSGFIPEVFDRELAGAGVPGVESFNFGLPAEFRFVDDLEAMIARGGQIAPDVVLLVVPWPAAPEPRPTFFHWIENDRGLMDAIFPFRKLPRDLFILAGQAGGSLGGVGRVYAESGRTVEQVAVDRGYYFISRQSHYANHELPVDFRAVTDTPDAAAARAIPRGPIFERLAELFAEHHIRCVFIPSYSREGEYAPPPPSNPAALAALADQPGFGVAGPDYFLYPNRLFSDPTHLNPRGADIYTRAVAGLVADYLKRPGPAAEGPGR